MKFEVLNHLFFLISWPSFWWLCLIELRILSPSDAVLYPHVTCGSAVKLLNKNLNLRLHSHEVKYASGSGQQSVSGVDKSDDVNSHWVVKGKNGKMCNRGEPIKCGEIIRLEHLETHKNLHSHHFPSPFSGNQEVSAYGTNGEGDTGDNWTVICSSDFWEREGSIRLKHSDTDAWLAATANTYGRPITGQREICGLSYSDSSCYWKTAEGVYIKPPESINPQISHTHSEL